MESLNFFGVLIFVQAALICTSCDIPAIVDYDVYRACSRCLKASPTKNFGEKPDFTFTDRIGTSGLYRFYGQPS